ncbi:putative ABC transport system substrate-binding protein [Bradyrhizobium sp. Rc2d]|uniref:ABC transporter substrate-binding protein n=1 Tax=Bradyrhizobium sp. Rc2d TaxID=1855321 RepID=UPI0008877870|nr:ABC transporter substrate-binding protein [Bradyrhizobium sp. Rc2d]SDJ30626.1 putative ABC transport system substrate-binding protein [Bradyrhizobium sp. Rc2d]
MRRRDFISLLGGTVTWPLAARAQQQKNVARIGFLATGPLESPETSAARNAFLQRLRELGYVEGQNIHVVVRAADSIVERLPALANELVRLKVDVIVAPNSLAARAVQQATTTVPTVVPVMGDPVGDGLVDSLARPGRNITGLTFLGPKLLPKRLALLKEALPAVSRVAALWQPRAYSEHTMRDMTSETEAAANALGLHVEFVAVSGPDDLVSAFSAIAAQRADALIGFPSPMFFLERRRIVELATEHRLPSMLFDREFVALGGLMSYGANITDSFRLGANYVDKILKGARPADLPVEQPTKFELCVNLKTAKDLGIDLPATLLARADEVIE